MHIYPAQTVITSCKYLAAVLSASLITSGGIVLADDTNHGRDLYATCANCHGTYGQTQGDVIPELAGMSKEQIISSMLAFKEDRHSATIMHQIAKGYTEQQIDLIATYISQQKESEDRHE